MHNHSVIEFVSSKLQSGVGKETFLAASSKAQASLQHYNGFVNRSIFHDNDQGLWIDLVQWADKKAAMMAAEAFMQDADAASLLTCLDHDTLAMKHFERCDGLHIKNEAYTNKSTSNCVEFLTYRLKAGANLEQYERVLEDIAQTIKMFPAFVQRDVGYDAETGQWLEVIYYRDRAAADAMFIEIKDAPCMQACMELLDESSLTMIFATPIELE